MKPSALLDVDLSQVFYRRDIHVPFSAAPDIFFDGSEFLFHLRTKYEYVDVCTYSFNSNHTHIRRLLTGLPLTVTLPQWTNNKTEHRYLDGVHTKLFIGYRDAKVKNVFIGSMNYVQGTTQNIMYRVGSGGHKDLFVKYFNHLWKTAA